MITSSGFGRPLTLATGKNCHLPLCERYFLRWVVCPMWSIVFASHRELRSTESEVGSKGPAPNPIAAKSLVIWLVRSRRIE